MKILIVNPNSTDAMTRDIGRTAERVASAGTEIVAVTAAGSTPSIESFVEDVVASAETVSTVLNMPGGFDAVVSACAYDPAVYALREALDVPVIGILEAASLVSRLLAPSFSVVTVLPRGVVHVEDVLTRTGLDRKCKSVIGVELGVLDLERRREESLQALQSACDEAVHGDGAEAVVLGCAGMSYYKSRLSSMLDVPLIDGVECAVGLAELCLRSGLSTSKHQTFAPLVPKEIAATEEGPGPNPLLSLLYGASSSSSNV